MHGSHAAWLGDVLDLDSLLCPTRHQRRWQDPLNYNVPDTTIWMNFPKIWVQFLLEATLPFSLPYDVHAPQSSRMICVERVCLDQLPERVPILANSLTPVNPVPLKVTSGDFGNNPTAPGTIIRHAIGIETSLNVIRATVMLTCPSRILSCIIWELSREQCCIGRSIPVAWESHLWFGKCYYCVHYQTQDGAIGGGRGGF